MNNTPAYVYVLPAYVYIPHVCLVSEKVKKKASDPLELELHLVVQICVHAEIWNPGPP